MRFVPAIPCRPLLIASLSSGGFQGELIACAMSWVSAGTVATCPVTSLLLTPLSGGPAYLWFCTPSTALGALPACPTLQHPFKIHTCDTGTPHFPAGACLERCWNMRNNCFDISHMKLLEKTFLSLKKKKIPPPVFAEFVTKLLALPSPR